VLLHLVAQTSMQRCFSNVHALRGTGVLNLAFQGMHGARLAEAHHMRGHGWDGFCWFPNMCRWRVKQAEFKFIAVLAHSLTQTACFTQKGC
jgi:hypothetical protein